MSSKPVIKKGPLKRAPLKKAPVKKAPAPEPTPAEPEPAAPEPAPVAAPPGESPPADTAPPAEAIHAETASAETGPSAESAPAADVAPPAESVAQAEAAPADTAAAPPPATEDAAAPAVEKPAATAAPAADAAPADTAPADATPTDTAPADATPTDTAPADATPTDTAPADATPTDTPPTDAAPADAASTEPPTEEPAAPAVTEAPADAAAAAAPPAEEPKAPTPPPPEVPTSEPLSVTVEDVNNTSVTVRWRPPENTGSGLDGYTVEYCKDQTTDWVVANSEPIPANRLVIKNLATGDLLHVRVISVNAGGSSPPGLLAEPVRVREIVDRPKIRLPRLLRSRLVKKVGEKVNLVIPFSGKPNPVVSWTKDGQPLDMKMVNIRSSDKDCILFIRQAERSHSGNYEMSVKVDSFEGKATFTLQVVELPGPPSSLTLVDTWGFNVALEWTPPQDNGNTEITGYTIQKADKKTGDWFTVLEHYHRLNATVSDLIMGNSYSFRVFAENKVGHSEEAAVTKTAAYIQKAGINYKPVAFKEHDFNEAPTFTTPLSDRAATVGYTTKLLCAVRGFPMPKVEWMKNSMIIGEDPKYRMINHQGICTLEIRKPSSFDGGVYTCRAKNALGEAAVACKLEVKQVINPAAEKK